MFAYILDSDSEPIIWAAIGAAAGVYLFVRGFRLLQRKRLIMNTPTAKIRSAAVGLVEVSGLACGPYTMTAPITAKACYYYRTMAWRYEQRGKSKEWVKVADESVHLPFFLDDNTGRVLINPQGAELEIHRDFHEEFGNSLFSTAPDFPQNVSSFLTRHAIPTDAKIKVEEYCIKPKNALFVLGTLAVNPGIEVSSTPVATLGSQAKFSVIFGSNQTASDGLSFSSNMQTEIVRLSREPGPTSAVEMSQQEKIAAALAKAGITNPAAWAAAGLSDMAAVNPAPVPAASDGTAAAPAPEQFDLRPPTVLMKGEHNPAFFISWRSQKDVVKSLGWKSAAMIWGGPVITLLSAYILAAHFGWL